MSVHLVNNVPNSYFEAENSANWKNWKLTMENELDSLDKHKVWEIVQKPAKSKLIKTKWVYSLKQDDAGKNTKYKARLVAAGFNQIKNIDYSESYSPVVNIESFRLLIALAAKLKLNVNFFDVKTAYLYGDLEETVYVLPPPGYEKLIGDDKVCKLKKSIYANRTRPDISFVMSYLSQFNHNPEKRHYNLAKRVLRYLMASKDKKLFYENEFGILNASSDASWGNAENGKSFSGGVVLLDTIDESNKLQLSAIPLNVPPDAVPGTESCMITAVEDQFFSTVETAINEPEKLLKRPRGSGESNIIFLAPTVYTMKYLKLKGKIAPEIENEGFSFIRQEKWEGPLTPVGLLKLVKRFEETGKSEDRARAGRPCLKEARAPCIAVGMEAIASEAASGTSSAREAARRLGLPPSSVRNILRRILQLYPYKLQSCHELLPADTAQREAFAKWAFSKMEQDPTWDLNILWTDEARFSLHGDVNNHNCRFWVTSNPREYTQKPLHSQKVTAWCGFTGSFIIGPFFFETQCPVNGWIMEMVNAQRYLKLLRELSCHV
ncbi:retrovirus-related Pol polyprotein from transposon TNT 1-94 [Trichonephila clavipes]|nr:retrovirus-related Pol polyprotein from transposon TNT 1-94 [Trichonephila clavipes]